MADDEKGTVVPMDRTIQYKDRPATVSLKCASTNNCVAAGWQASAAQHQAATTRSAVVPTALLVVATPVRSHRPATVCGGAHNSAQSNAVFIGGGHGHVASAGYSRISGGYSNNANVYSTTVTGGCS